MPRIHQKGAGDGDPLALAARKRQAAFTHRGLIALRKLQDELVGGGGFGRLDHLFLTGLRTAEGDVVADRPAKQGQLLKAPCRSGCAVIRRLADVVPVDQYPAGRRVVEERGIRVMIVDLPDPVRPSISTLDYQITATEPLPQWKAIS